MSDQQMTRPRVAIVDFGLGNLHSVLRACLRAGMDAAITSSRHDVLGADAVLLPGVGAFGDAMANLRRTDLVGPLRQIHAQGTPLVGVCLGLQLLLSESEEFGTTEGLNLIEGRVVRFAAPRGEQGRVLKVPQVGWNRIAPPPDAPAAWEGTPLWGLAAGTHMYFVHSYYVRPVDPSVRLAVTRYGDIEFCSAVRSGNTVAFQFHPEKSGPDGLRIYQQIAGFITANATRKEFRHAG